jgi:hypothetical protein
MRRALLLAWLALGCHDQFRFDEPRPDAADALAGVDACADPTCGWRKRDDCGGGVCGMECPDRATCTGSCPDGCRAECETRSDCTLSTGPSASVMCESATCDLQVGAASNIYCNADAHCTLHCRASCSVTCSANSRCTLACAGDDVPHAVTGSASCP